jgi:uncharacterized membrane protein (UPF0127 family)
MTNDVRRELLNKARSLGYPGSILEVYQAYSQGIDMLADFEVQQRAQQIQSQQAAVAQTPQEQSQGLIPFHQAGQTNQSMVFPNVKPNQPFTTQGLTAPIDMTKVDNQGNVVESYKAVQPGISNIPTGPYEGTMIETPAKSYQTGGQRKPLILPDDKYGRMRQQAYADSLSLYNNSQRRVRDFNEFATANNLRTHLSGDADYFPIEHPTIGPTNRTGFIYREDMDGLVRNDGTVNTQITPQAMTLLNRGVTSMDQIPIYKKPVQPIKIQKEPQKLKPKSALLPTSDPGVVKSFMKIPDNPNVKQTFGSTSTNYAGKNKTRFEGNFNLETGEWDIKEKKPVKRELALEQPFKEGGAKCYTCGGLKAKVAYNKFGYKK